MTFEEFREDYPGFDWDNGEIVFTFKDNAKVIIWNENSLYRTIAQKYFTYVVANWTHTQNVMVVVLHKNERKDKKMTKREKEIRRVILLNCLFDEEKRRTKIEQEAERLHIAGRPDKAAKVLNELDDSIIIELRERLKKLDEEPEEKKIVFSEPRKVFREEKTFLYKEEDGRQGFAFANNFSIEMQANGIRSEKTAKALRKLLDTTAQEAKKIIAAD